jgi:hypothetical protein
VGLEFLIEGFLLSPHHLSMPHLAHFLDPPIDSADKSSIVLTSNSAFYPLLNESINWLSRWGLILSHLFTQFAPNKLLHNFIHNILIQSYLLIRDIAVFLLVNVCKHHLLSSYFNNNSIIDCKREVYFIIIS